MTNLPELCPLAVFIVGLTCLIAGIGIGHVFTIENDD